MEKVRAVSSPMPELAPVIMTKGFDMVTANCDLYDFQANLIQPFAYKYYLLNFCFLPAPLLKWNAKSIYHDPVYIKPVFGVSPKRQVLLPCNRPHRWYFYWIKNIAKIETYNIIGSYSSVRTTRTTFDSLTV